MAHDSPDSPPGSSQPPPRAANRLMLFAGVAGACALGVGAGLWARPADTERDPRALHVAKVVEPEKPAGKLEIVVDETPAPIGKPIEVLPGAEPSRPAFVLPPAPAGPEPIAPSRPPEGLVRVQAVAPPAPQVDPAAVKLESERLAQRAARAEQARLEKIKAEKAEKAEQARQEKVRLERVRAERAEAAHAEKARLEKVKLEKVERQARAEAKAELLAEQKAARAKQVKLAKAKAAKAEAVEVAEAKRSALAKLAHALSRAVRHDKAVEVAAKKPKAEPVRGEGPLRLASYKRNNSRCVSADPGAAIVCADPALASADKRMARAYQEAEAAGVSPAQLKRQQDRWLAARSAAAREAPWAVHDVYLARIAELNDQARDARGGGY